MSVKKIVMTLLFVSVLIVCLAGCESDTEPGDESTVQLGTPVVPGLIISTDGAYAIGHWGNPHEGEVSAFPNPFFVGPPLSVIFHVHTRTRVRVWVVRAIGPYEGIDEHQSNEIVGMVVASSLVPKTVATLVNEVRDPGSYAATWMEGFTAASGVPSGFYRVYVEADTIDYVDVLHLKSCTELPPGLEWYPCIR